MGEFLKHGILIMMQEKLQEAITFASIGFSGGTAHYFYMISQGKPFKMSEFFLNAFIGSFIGWMVGQFIPPSSYQLGIVGFASISSYVIMQFVETKMLSFLEMYVTSKIKNGNKK